MAGGPTFLDETVDGGEGENGRRRISSFVGHRRRDDRRADFPMVSTPRRARLSKGAEAKLIQILNGRMEGEVKKAPRPDSAPLIGTVNGGHIVISVNGPAQIVMQ